MEALADIQVRDHAVVVDDVLILADLHVGRGAASNLELPVGDGDDMVERFAGLLTAYDPSEVILAGDLLHSFETVPRLVEETIGGLRSVAREAGVSITVTPGNHDTMLDVVWDGPTTPERRIGDTVVCHGHVQPETDANRYIVGHDHPTITIEGQRRPCYLAGDSQYEGADVIMLPAFNRLVRGVEINDLSAGDFMSPFVRETGTLAPVVRDESAAETLVFPQLGEFRQRL